MPKGYAIITGASSGIGLEFVNQLAKKKYNFVLISRRKAELDKIATNIKKKYKVDCIVFPCDLSIEEEIKRATNELIKLKNIDYLINCAGFGYPTYFHKMDPKIAKDEIFVHVLATTQLTGAILPIMIKQNKGNIINVSSIASYLTTSKSNAIYNSTKAYIRVFTETLIDEMDANNYNVHIQTLCPGFVKTNFLKDYDASYVPRIFWMRVNKVVERSIRRVERGSGTYIAGFQNKFIVWVLSFWIINWMFNLAARKSNIK